MTPQQLTDKIRAFARQIGADLVGIAPGDIPQESATEGASAYEEWLASGMHGTMEFMARDPERRRGISNWFPAARSVVLLGFGYAKPPSPQRGEGNKTLPLPMGEGKGEGRIARYALSPDYHDTLRRKLERLEADIKSALPEAQTKLFIDSSPVLERLYGRYAGIGWVGKNTMLLSNKIGSFYFLSGLAIDQELIYDEPMPDHCGTCNKCIASCPTDAFPKDRVLDASKCISYFTIEHRGSIPQGFRAAIGDWIFGCDICQEVCPWNRFSVQNTAFAPTLPKRMSLEAMTNLSSGEFKRTLGHTPIERARWKGFVRNALLAMGNSGNPDFIPTLERFAVHEEPAISEQARWSLAQLTSPLKRAASA